MTQSGTGVRGETPSATFCQRQNNADRWTEAAATIKMQVAAISACERPILTAKEQVR